MNTEDQITLTIDDEIVQVPKGMSLHKAIESTGRGIPVICYHDATTSEGLCRQCVVEIEGWRTLAASCVTEAADGMVVYTKSARVIRARKTILEMLNASVDLTEAPDLQLQMVAYDADPCRFPDAKTRQQPLKDDNPFYVRDYQKCVLCWRCVQA